MREWSQFTDGAIGEFNSTLGLLVEFVETSLYCENAKHSLAAGHVYLNGGEGRDRNWSYGLEIAKILSPNYFKHISQVIWADV